MSLICQPILPLLENVSCNSGIYFKSGFVFIKRIDFPDETEKLVSEISKEKHIIKMNRNIFIFLHHVVASSLYISLKFGAYLTSKCRLQHGASSHLPLHTHKHMLE